MKFFRTRWRVTTLDGCVFSAEAWRWWLPFWCDIGGTFSSPERATEAIRNLNLRKRVVQYVEVES